FCDQNEYLTKDLSQQTADLLWYQLYHDVLFELTHDEKARQEMIDACRSYYRDNIKELEVIDKFENEYRSEEALQWYLRKSFIYKIISKALRIKDFDQLYTFRYFMKDLTECLDREHQKIVESGKEILFMYRGMKLTNDQIEKFKENESKLVSINGFFTTSSLCSTALNQAMKLSKDTDLILVLLKIQYHVQHLNNSGIVAVNVHFGESTYEGEQEILFDLNITFRLESVKMEEGMCLIKMNASNEGQLIKENFIKDSRRQMKNLSTSILFGRLMCDMGQWNQSQHFFEHLLNNSNIYNEDLTKIECSLGEVLQWKGEWNEARKYYDRAYDRIMNVKPTRIKDSADILLNIGKIFYLEGKYEEVGDYYEQALAMREENYSFTKINNPCAPNRRRRNVLSRIRASFQSVLLSSGGLFHPCSGRLWTRKFRETSRWFRSKYATNRAEPVDEQSSQTHLQEMCRNLQETGWLQLMEIHLDNYVPIAISLHSFEKILFRQAKYDEALIFHKQALAMLEEYYQCPHIDIAVCLGYIGQVLTYKRKYDETLDFCQRAMSIYTKYYPNGHVYIASTLNYIGYVLYLQGKHDEALKTYERVLAMLQKYYPSDHVKIAVCLTAIGNVHYEQGKYDKAIGFQKQGLQILQRY
ncbi:unnamed protein product, partial [Rotaria sp. Silwood2]